MKNLILFSVMMASTQAFAKLNLVTASVLSDAKVQTALAEYTAEGGTLESVKISSPYSNSKIELEIEFTIKDKSYKACRSVTTDEKSVVVEVGGEAGCD